MVVAQAQTAIHSPSVRICRKLLIILPSAAKIGKNALTVIRNRASGATMGGYHIFMITRQFYCEIDGGQRRRLSI